VRLKRTVFPHDIGKITLSADILAKDTLAALSEEDLEKMRQHPVVGCRILNMFDDTLDIAEYVYGHHERWDGKGYLRGLKGEEIPLTSRIILVAETYDRVVNQGALSPEERKAASLKVIREGSGKQFDPNIAKLFVQLMEREGA